MVHRRVLRVYGRMFRGGRCRQYGEFWKTVPIAKVLVIRPQFQSEMRSEATVVPSSSFLGGRGTNSYLMWVVPKFVLIE